MQFASRTSTSRLLGTFCGRTSTGEHLHPGPPPRPPPPAPPPPPPPPPPPAPPPPHEAVRRTRALMLETRSFWVRIALAPALSVFMYDI